MLTVKQARALAVLRDHPGCTANMFAVFYFTDPSQEYLFTAVSNQGNGACTGKKAWLCAGSLLGKLSAKGFVRQCAFAPGRYRLSLIGEKVLGEFENKLK